MRRIRSREAAAMLGLSTRGVQAMAARGELPGAAKIGALWTFDPDKLQRFLDEKEAECAMASLGRAAFESRTYSREAASIGCEPPLNDSNIEKAYERAMLKLLGRTAPKRSKPSRAARKRSRSEDDRRR